ncbi:glycosyltransferase family 2 protein [Flavobacterium sp. 102]|uniref:glycosyltransferase family 2 protein n=1 Tax=Flavobacterium sp. 102 TaxID=2135623 RepID=UPI000EB308C7|nr:glycosyltransferase family 2 protein [Flavobacterium sp. 102]RKS01903.1 glycosyl transferase family 2 [Flavobacterium sp. 102]
MLAIVIPYFKLAFFEETLASLANQTDQRFTVYIGDDASPETPKDMLAKFKDKFQWVYHRFDDNLGGKALVKQWERCISLTKNEEWLMILGDDDYLTDTVVEQFYAQLPQFLSKTNLVRFASQTIVEETKHKAAVCNNPIWESATDSYFRKLMKISRSSLSEYVFLKSAFEKHRFYNYPLAWNSDDRAWLDFAEDKPIYSINESVVCVRLSGLNITGKKDNLPLKSNSLVAFYTFLIEKKLNYYTKYQRIKILRKYQEELKKIRPLQFKDWGFLGWHYLTNLNRSTINEFFKKRVSNK